MNRKRQAQDLERNLKGAVHFLADKYNDFQQQCRVFNPKRGYSPTTVKEIKEAYKTITAKLAEARALQQMLRGKYKGYVQVDTQLQREVEELSLMYRKDYRFFELNHSAWEREHHVSKQKALPPTILSHLYNIYRESPSLSSLILCFRGDFASLRTLKERVALGERDTSAMEGDEIWFVLAGVKSPEDPILRSTLIETLLQGLHGKVKGVVVKLTEGDEVREEVLRGMRRGLAGVKEGDIKIL
ncbi:MAG: hypothetical protein A2Y65_12355 [Deltaproteobacteria bacterium RBG_13_52_11]|nr:MAG: hypothetical protein A2Y65_12355 [Deltaproteobacteria bacterium RBG_13_52_11]